MVYKNKINLGTIAEIARNNDDRMTTDINSRNRFVEYIDGYFYSRRIETDFNVKGKQMILSKKGTRPNTNLIYQSIDYGVTKYLIKFTKCDVWICDTELSCDGKDRNGIQIATEEEDLQYVFVALFGAGGGGSGSSLFPATSGDGGAGGGALFCCVRLEHDNFCSCKRNTLPIVIGKGGQGSNGRNNGEDGLSTGYYYTNEIYCIGGGGEGGRASVAKTTLSGNVGIPFIEEITVAHGGYGGLSQDNGQSIDKITTAQYGASQEKTQIGCYGTSGGISDGRGGGGGAGALGNGGNGKRYNQNGEDGQLTAGGSGGSYGTAARKGGNGGHGEIRIYY